MFSFAEAIVANTISCDCTEIGIGSTVWKKFSGTNVNNWPGRRFITKLENDDRGAQYDMGRIDAYVERYSFFHIQVRKQGEDTWSENISKDGVFAVKGNTPVERFHAIRIYHPRGQYEFRMRPYPGMLAYHRAVNNGKRVYLLESKKGLDAAKNFEAQQLNLGDIGQDWSAWFEGKKLDGKYFEENASNPESFKGPIGPNESEFVVTGVEPDEYGVIGSGVWVNEPENNNPGITAPPSQTLTPLMSANGIWFLRRVQWTANQQRIEYFWNGEKISGDEEWFSGTGKPTDVELIQFERFDPNPSRCNNYDAKDSQTIRYQPRGVQTDDYHYARTSSDGSQTTYFYSIVRKVSVGRAPEGDPEIVRPTGGSGSGLKLKLQKFNDGSYEWTVDSKGNGYEPGDQVKIEELPDDAPRVKLTVTSRVSLQEDPGWDNDGDTAPYSKVYDYYTQKKETASHHNQPEHRITYINEFVKEDNEEIGTYDDMASVGFILNSSKQLTSLNQLSVYYRKGLKLKT